MTNPPWNFMQVLLKVYNDLKQAIRVDVVSSPDDPVYTDDLLSRLEIADGNVTGIEYINKFAKNNDVDIANIEDVWNGGGTYNYLLIATQLNVVSDSTIDDVGQDGAESIKILGLDSNYNYIEEVINLDGTTPVQTVNSYLRVYRAFVEDSGSLDTNNGTIQVYIGSNVQAQIDPQEGQTFMSHFTIPAGKTGYITQAEAQLTSSRDSFGIKEGNLAFFVKPFGKSFRAQVDIGLNSEGGPYIITERIIPSPIEEKSDVRFRFEAYSNDSKVVVAYSILLKDN